MVNFNYDVVIPVFNAEATLEATLKSVLAQSVKPNRVIVVDDLSTDGSFEIASRFDVEIYRNSEKGYSAGSRNRGLSKSNAEWIATIDADDIWQLDAIEQLAESISLEPAIDVLGGIMNPFGIGLTEPFDRRNQKNIKKNHLQLLKFEDFVKGSPLAASASLFRRSSLIKVGGWPTPTFAEDYHLLIELYNSGASIFRLNSSVGFYRLSVSQKSTFVSLQTESQLVALNLLFKRKEGKASHNIAILKVWFSYLARLNNANKVLIWHEIPANFFGFKVSPLIKLNASLLCIGPVWKCARFSFFAFKKLRAKTLRFP